MIAELEQLSTRLAESSPLDDLLTRERSPLADLLNRPVSRSFKAEQQRIDRLLARSQFEIWAWPLHFCREVRHQLFVDEPIEMDWTVYRECVFVGNCRKVFRSPEYSFGVIKDSVTKGA